jgi:hypothetical protein
MRRAWDNDVDDRSRVLLERASIFLEIQSKELMRLKERLISNAKCLEVVEAELASRRWPLLGNDDPGAAL